MLQRLLIANRGEIACRISATARKMGITAIAVYSEADSGARHVRVADEAYLLGPSPAAQSYLDIDRIIDCARRAKADAIHPGYGFLSENSNFAQACLDAGFFFIGPPAEAIRAMGSKSAAKSAMAAAGVPVAPGYHGEEQTAERLQLEAQRIGFPLIVKASAGGGGKGMQVVQTSEEVHAAVESARRLALASFGDPRLLLERYFVAARHVEVQVFADAHGDAVVLYDRDCSVQRRHQKVAEEAPAPALRSEVRAAMAQAALTVTRAVGYRGAGTIEFLVDAEQRFYFMEMNTRLQVEHPVTEMITGVDLVEWQLRAASGERLADFAGTLSARGAAVEVRLYAEDPARDYLPSVGKISHLRWPADRNGLRLDVGVDCGDTVSPFYDPMLGKLIAWAETRGQAIDRLAAAVAQLEIAGIVTNRRLLLSILCDEQFRAGAVTTDFLVRRASQLAFADERPADTDLIAGGLWCATSGSPDAGSPWDGTDGWWLGAPAQFTWILSGNPVSVTSNGAHHYLVGIGGRSFAVRIIERAGDSIQIEFDRRSRSARVIRIGANIHVYCEGRDSVLTIARAEDALQAMSGAALGSLTTPLPGTVVAVLVDIGQLVQQGEALVTVEAMKMEHTLKSPRAGRVRRIAFGMGERVVEGAVLIELDDA